jgi:hypothetical protein
MPGEMTHVAQHHYRLAPGQDDSGAGQGHLARDDPCDDGPTRAVTLPAWARQGRGDLTAEPREVDYLPSGRTVDNQYTSASCNSPRPFPTLSGSRRRC